MTCNQARECFLAYSQGEPVAHEVVEHIQSCSACAAALGEFEAVGRLLSGLGPAPVRSGFADAVMSAIRAESVPRCSWWRLTGHPAVGLVAAAASVLVLVGAGGLLWLRANSASGQKVAVGEVSAAPLGSVSPSEPPSKGVGPLLPAAGELELRPDGEAASAGVEKPLADGESAQGGAPRTVDRAQAPQAGRDQSVNGQLSSTSVTAHSDAPLSVSPPVNSEGASQRLTLGERLAPDASSSPVRLGAGATARQGGYGGAPAARALDGDDAAPLASGPAAAEEVRSPPTYTFRFDGGTLKSALEQLSAVAGVTITLEAQSHADVRVYATLKDVTVDEALERLSGMAGLRCAESPETGYVLMAEEP